MKKSFLNRQNSSKQRSELTTCRCFSLTVSKYGTHLEQSFFIIKCSCGMANTPLFDVFKVSYCLARFQFTIDRNHFVDFFTFSGTTADNIIYERDHDDKLYAIYVHDALKIDAQSNTIREITYGRRR